MQDADNTANNAEVMEWIEMLEEAQEKLREAHQLIENYCNQSHDRHTRAYIADHLRILIDEDHGFLSRDANLGAVIHRLLHGEE